MQTTSKFQHQKINKFMKVFIGNMIACQNKNKFELEFLLSSSNLSIHQSAKTYCPLTNKPENTHNSFLSARRTTNYPRHVQQHRVFCNPFHSNKRVQLIYKQFDLAANL